MEYLVLGFSMWWLIALPLALLLQIIIYRLYFSPISHIPGPKLAALTQLYEIYYDIYLGGQFSLHLAIMHEKYGLIVRINPWEVHINDPEFYESVYTSSKPFDKVYEHISWESGPGSGHATVPHSLHRIRRTALNPLFSKKQIYAFGPEIQERASKLCNRILYEYKSTGKALNLNRALRCFTVDVVTQYAFAREYKFLDCPDFIEPYLEVVRNMACTMHIVRLFPILRIVFFNLPQRLVTSIYPAIGHFFSFEDDILVQINDLISGRNQAHKDASHQTIFHELLDSDLPSREKTAKRLADEGMVVVAAGSETTRGALSLVVFHVLNNQDVLRKVKVELASIWPDVDSPPSWQELEKLPYFTAVIQEGLRLISGVSFRLARVSHTPIHYGNYTIPPGTPFSMCQQDIHFNPAIFPSSKTFNPSRWLANPVTGEMPLAPNGKLLSRYMVAFSRGTRSCVGMHIAYAELYICLANMFRKCDMKLYETTVKDVELHSDYFLPQPHPDSKGIRVLVI